MNCPSCGAGIGFRSERAPYTVCASCQTMVVRKDLNVEALGKVAECQHDGSPISIGTQGGYEGKAFEVIGRIQLAYQGGFWNEWYLHFSDGSNGWLGEALGQYFVSFPEPDASAFSDFRALELGAELDYDDQDWVVLDKKKVNLNTFEGELPYLIENPSPFLTVDLRNTKGEGLTVDFSDAEATLYRGRWMNFADLELSGLTRPADPMIAVPASETVAVKCSSCGAPHEITAPGRSQLLVCQYCDASLDASTPELTALGDMMEKAGEIAKWAKIPIGTTANLSDGQYKVIGMMQSCTQVYGVTYRWKDYLLYNHLTGYRWLNENNGHYTYFEQLYAVPESSRTKRRGFSYKNRPVGMPSQQYILMNDKKNLHFSTAEVQVEKVVGEFYWRVQKGETSITYDYIDPPNMISASVGKDDITWTKGRYLDREELGKIFPTVEFDDQPQGVAPPQPNPYVRARKAMSLPLFVAFVAAIVLIASGLFLPDGQASVAQGSVDVVQAGTQDSGVGEGQPFTLAGKGRRDLSVTIDSDLKDRWINGNLSVRSSKSRYEDGQLFVLADFEGKGAKKGTVVVRNAPAGEPLRIVVKAKTGPPLPAPLIVSESGNTDPLNFSLNYNVSVLPGQRAWSGLFYFWLLCLIPLWWVRSGRNKFEKKRWYESDYG
jgi:uncharacterized protein DUF4178